MRRAVARAGSVERALLHLREAKQSVSVARTMLETLDEKFSTKAAYIIEAIEWLKEEVDKL